jgi:hypothetical protein
MGMTGREAAARWVWRRSRALAQASSQRYTEATAMLQMNPCGSVQTIRGYTTHPTKPALVSTVQIQVARLIAWGHSPCVGMIAAPEAVTALPSDTTSWRRGRLSWGGLFQPHVFVGGRVDIERDEAEPGLRDPWPHATQERQLPVRYKQGLLLYDALDLV